MPCSIGSKLGDLLDNGTTRAVLEEHMPGISAHPQFSMGRGYPLAVFAKFVEKEIPAGMLEKGDAELKAVD